VDFKSDLDVLHLFEDFKKCDCTHDVKPEYRLEPIKEEEQPLPHPEILGLLARNKRRLESTSECSTMDTLSETGTNASSSRGRFKKRKRNLTGWPSNKPRKRQAKPTEAEEKIVGHKLAKEKGTKKVKVVYRTKTRARGQSVSSPAKRKARSESPRKASNSSGEALTTQSSPVRKKMVLKRTCRTRTRNSTSLRLRR